MGSIPGRVVAKTVNADAIASLLGTQYPGLDLRVFDHQMILLPL